MYQETTFNQFGQRSLTPQDLAEIAAQKLYAQASKRPFIQKLIALFKKEDSRLVQLNQASAIDKKATQKAFQQVQLNKICGTTNGRCQDFDNQFRPLNGRTEDRRVSGCRTR